MKKTNLHIVAAILIASIFAASCSVLKDLEYEVKENPIEMHGDKVTVKIDGKFIEKGLNKKAFVTLTPTLINAAGEELEFEPKSFKGEKAAGNGEVVKKDGHSFSYTSTRPYDSRFENSELVVKYIALKGTKEKLNDKTAKIADATIVTPELLQNDDKVVMGKDNLVRSVKKSTKAVINFNKAKSNLRRGETTDADILAMESFILAGNTNSKIVFNNIEIVSYASPEGEMEKNSNLALDRGETAEKYLMKANKKLKLNLDPTLISKTPKGEDWDGLKELISKSNHEDKNIIVAVAEMESDPTKREQEIKALSTTYKFLDKDIFPQLRRSQMVLNYTEFGLTDEELKATSQSAPQTLSVEELLFTAGLVSDKEEKLRLFNEVIKKDASDYRGFTNAGVILYNKKMTTEANKMFTKAYNADKNAITSNNMGVVKRQAGDIAGAAKLFGDATATGDAAKYNMGLINIKKGEYSNAISNMGSTNTFNKALAQTLNKDYSSASSSLANSTEANTAKGLYLKAVIASRNGNESEVISSLVKAFEKDSSLRAKAKKDREFIKYFENAAFIAL
ncbi:MAG: tetratricopeptide (TPR) repeat protein [Flavobacteriales bacterium]|jgi:tetratricopeptide (TPR) repeat protein